MKKWTYLVAACMLAGATPVLTGCIDNDEPAGIEQLRVAKSELLRAQALVEAAKVDQMAAQNALIEAQAAQSRQHIANLERTGIVGQMSTMIAHELKQPLGAITNFANGLLRRLKRGAIDPKVFSEALEEIVMQGTRASEIVNRVRSYAKQQQPVLELTDMQEIVRNAISTFERSRRSSAKIEADLQPFLWADIDAWEIELAILNLLKNAADSVEGLSDAKILVRVRAHDVVSGRSRPLHDAACYEQGGRFGAGLVHLFQYRRASPRAYQRLRQS